MSYCNSGTNCFLAEETLVSLRRRKTPTTIGTLEKRIAELRQQSASSFGAMPGSKVTFEHIAAKIRQMFAGNTEGTAEAVEIVQRMFRDERQAMIMQLTARKTLNSEGTIMNLKEHLKTMHQERAAHHVAMATVCRKAGESHAALAAHLADSDATAAQHHTDLAGHHEALAQTHTEMAEQCLKCHKSIDELDGSELDGSGSSTDERLKAVTDRLEKLVGGMVVPTNVSGINRNPDAGPSNKVTAIPRAGAPDPKDLAKIPVEFHHLLRTA